jgi:hypothetical protein
MTLRPLLFPYYNKAHIIIRNQTPNPIYMIRPAVPYYI